MSKIVKCTYCKRQTYQPMYGLALCDFHADIEVDKYKDPFSAESIYEGINEEQIMERKRLEIE